MSQSPRLYPLSTLPAAITTEGFDEIALLQAAEQQGIALSPILVIDERVETDFYRLNNLPERLSQLFEGIDLQDPDEDDIEELAPRAQALLRKSYLLDEVIDDIYSALATAPARLTVRYPYPHSQEVRRSVLRGRPALMALKQLWLARWSYQALWQRLAHQQSIALPAYPVLVHAPIASEVPSLAEQLSSSHPLRCFVDAEGALVHLAPTS